MTIGVYSITCTGTNKRYVGSSRRSIENRFSHHQALLKKRCHHNTEMQNDYNKFGVEKFKWVIVLECPKELTFVEEQYRIEYWKSRGKCYNVQPNARSAIGTRYTEEQKKRISISAKERCSPEWRATVSERVKAQHKAGKFGRKTWRTK